MKSSNLKSAYERKLINEMIKPGGATKKPQEVLLSNFTNSISSLDVTVILSIFYYVLRESKKEWISKLVK